MDAEDVETSGDIEFGGKLESKPGLLFGEVLGTWASLGGSEAAAKFLESRQKAGATLLSTSGEGCTEAREQEADAWAWTSVGFRVLGFRVLGFRVLGL